MGDGTLNMRQTRILLVAATAAVVGCGLALGAPCQKVDLLSQEAADLAKLAKDNAGVDANADWLRHALRCSVGPFVVYGPARGSSHNLIVTENGHFITIIAPADILVFEGNNRLVTSLSD